MSSGVLNPKKSVLLLIDSQTRLIQAMDKPDELLKKLERVVEGAGWMEIPTIYCEQAPQKLGPTHPELLQFLKKSPKIEKQSFSLFGVEKFKSFSEKLLGKSVVVVGIETHVCVLQTVLDLLSKIKCKAYVVADATASRNAIDHKFALERMRDHGAEIVTSEMVLMEWMKTAEHKDFKIIQRLFK